MGSRVMMGDELWRSRGQLSSSSGSDGPKAEGASLMVELSVMRMGRKLVKKRLSGRRVQEMRRRRSESVMSDG
jgi:hypothetical protein